MIRSLRCRMGWHHWRFLSEHRNTRQCCRCEAQQGWWHGPIGNPFARGSWATIREGRK